MKKITISLLALTGISAQYPSIALAFDYIILPFIQRFINCRLFLFFVLSIAFTPTHAQVASSPEPSITIEPKFTPEGLARIRRDTFIKSSRFVPKPSSAPPKALSKAQLQAQRSKQFKQGEIVTGSFIDKVLYFPLSILKAFLESRAN